MAPCKQKAIPASSNPELNRHLRSLTLAQVHQGPSTVEPANVPATWRRALARRIRDGKTAVTTSTPRSRRVAKSQGNPEAPVEGGRTWKVVRSTFRAERAPRVTIKRPRRVSNFSPRRARLVPARASRSMQRAVRLPVFRAWTNGAFPAPSYRVYAQRPSELVARVSGWPRIFSPRSCGSTIGALTNLLESRS